MTRANRLAAFCLIALVLTVLSASGTFFSLALAAHAVPRRPAYVQGNYTCSGGSLVIAKARFGNLQTVGDINIVAIGWNDARTSITSVSDSAGNRYHVAVPTRRAYRLSQAIYYAPNIVGSRTNTVKVTFNAPADHADIRIMEYKNMKRTNPFSRGSTAAGRAGPARSGTVLIAATPQVLVVAGMTKQSFSAAGAGYTTRMLTSPDGDIIEDKIAMSPGRYRATAKLHGNWLIQLAAFRGV